MGGIVMEKKDEDVVIEFIEKKTGETEALDVAGTLERALELAEKIESRTEKLLMLTKTRKISISVGGIMFVIGMIGTILLSLMIIDQGIFNYVVEYWGFFFYLFIGATILDVIGGILLTIK